MMIIRVSPSKMFLVYKFIKSNLSLSMNLNWQQIDSLHNLECIVFWQKVSQSRWSSHKQEDKVLGEY